MDISNLLCQPYPLQFSRQPSRLCRDNNRKICILCNKSFVSSAHLNIHDSTVHKHLKPYQCDICDKAFGQRGTLTRHRSAVHEKRKNHKCKYPGCEKKFSARWTLFVHKRSVHENLRPFSCAKPGCTRRFGNRWNRKTHESHVHGIGVDDYRKNKLELRRGRVVV